MKTAPALPLRLPVPPQTLAVTEPWKLAGSPSLPDGNPPLLLSGMSYGPGSRGIVSVPVPPLLHGPVIVTTALAIRTWVAGWLPGIVIM